LGLWRRETHSSQLGARQSDHPSSGVPARHREIQILLFAIADQAQAATALAFLRERRVTGAEGHQPSNSSLLITKTAWGLSWPASKLLQVRRPIGAGRRRSQSSFGELRAFSPASGTGAAWRRSSAAKGGEHQQKTSQQATRAKRDCMAQRLFNQCGTHRSLARLDPLVHQIHKVDTTACLPQHRHNALVCEARQACDFVQPEGFSAHRKKKVDAGPARRRHRLGKARIASRCSSA